MNDNKFTKSFKALLISQGCGAFNDNFFKTILAFYIMDNVSEGKIAFYISLTGALLILPFILFSPIAGYLSDRYSKRQIAVWTRAVEPVFVTIGLFAFHYHYVKLMLFTVFLFGTQSAIFSPSKYGILPELVKHKQLSRANGYLEMSTFLAILLGTTVAGQIQAFPQYVFIVSMLILYAVAFSGWYYGVKIEKVPAVNPDTKPEYNPFKSTYNYLREIALDNNLLMVMIGCAWFWFVGAVFQLSVFVHGRDYLMLSSYQTGLLLTALSVGIGIGSIYTGRVSAGKVELGLVPLGAFGLSLTSLGISLSTTLMSTSVMFLLLGISGGIFIVPLNSYFQAKSPAEKRGRYLAVSNLLTNSFMVMASVFFWLLKDKLGVGTPAIYGIICWLSFFSTLYAMYRMPEVWLRCMNWILVHTIYRCRTFGLENIPETGGALIVCNHVSYADPVILMAATDRPIRFLMYRPIYMIPGIHLIAKTVGAIPVGEGESKQSINNSLTAAREAVARGELVCIFAEGALSRTGNLMKFKRGLENIMQGLDAPIIPAFLDSIWGSIFSYKGGKFFWKFPRQIPYPVNLAFGKALPADSAAFEVRQAVSELGADIFKERPAYKERLDYRFIREVRKNLFKTLIVDSSGHKLNGLKVLISTFLFKDYFAGSLQKQKNVAILLPPGVPAALINFALTISGRVPVNLNYTVSEQSLQSVLKQCEIEDLIGSAKFAEKIKFNIPVGIKLHEVTEIKFSVIGKIKSAALALLPAFALTRILMSAKESSQQLATIIFSSGSSGEPKGIMLSHANIISNIEGIYQVFDLEKDDALLGILPFFHSFGFTVCLWLPIFSGIKAAYHFNPLDTGVIAKLVSTESCTIILATPTFLSFYLKKIEAEKFKTLRRVVVGAEKLKRSLAEEFKNKFGIEPQEGYGATELSPIVAINIDNVEAGAVKQTGTKAEKVGQPLPNIAVKIVNPETFEKLKPGEDGLVLVKGPNVMLGYLQQAEKTAAVIKEGWYVSGDIGNLDNEGFLKITDRLSRFSKIAGEMVPHISVEQAVLEAIGSCEAVVAVTAVSDEAKGEKLMVLHSVEIDVESVRKCLASKGFPNLWIPAKDAFIKVSEIPILGSGKFDLAQIKIIAQSFKK